MNSGYRNVKSKDGSLNPQLKDPEVIAWIRAESEDLDCPISVFTELVLRRAYEDFKFYGNFTRLRSAMKDFKNV